MLSKEKLFKRNPEDTISWVDHSDKVGVMEFTFDGEKFYNMFADYPYRLTKEEKEIFDRENPFWADFFSDRV